MEFQSWHTTVNRAGAGEGSWRDFLELFTDDVVYHEQMAGILNGKEGIWGWAEPSLAQFPGSRTVAFPEHFHVIDETNGTIVAKLDNVMSDPGDGSQWAAAHVSILTYAGNGKFSKQEDIYDVTSFLDLIEAWGRRAMELGTFDATQRGWFEQVYPDIVPQSVPTDIGCTRETMNDACDAHDTSTPTLRVEKVGIVIRIRRIHLIGR